MCADMATIHAAQRYRCIVELWDDAIKAATRDEGTAVLVERSVRLEVASALRITEHAASRLMGIGRALVYRYPQVWESMSHADITETHATIIVEGLDELEDVRDELVAEVLTLAEQMPTGPFRRALRRIVDREREATIAERHTDAVAYRHVQVEPGVDGMAWLTAHLPAVEANAIYGRLTAIAKTLDAADDERTLDQKRADVFGDLLIDGETTSLPDTACGIRPTVTITVPALTLLTGDGPTAQVDGVGPIPLDRARELCGAASGWMRDPRRSVRHRPHHRLAPRRRNRRHEPRPALPRASHPQTPHRLASAIPTRRNARTDLSRRAGLPRPTRTPHPAIHHRPTTVLSRRHPEG
ncbi:hypothetical protein BWL13_02115 [Microbacterium oleivorans]|nr:hypothetical protein BWL13_02115 [Microbacterium oleivorans]